MKILVYIFALLFAAAVLWGIGSSVYTSFVLGGLLWNATPWQMVLHLLFPLLGIFLTIAALILLTKHLFKSK